MKYLKVFAIAIITFFAFETANAQVVVKARIGQPVQRRTVVVRRPVHRTVVVQRPLRTRRYYHRRGRRVEVIRRHY